jgi:hypothetical protein
VEFFDYNAMDDEYDKMLEESEPCQDCGSTESLALVVITSVDKFGHVLIFCADCHIEEGEDLSSCGQEESRI